MSVSCQYHHSTAADVAAAAAAASELAPMLAHSNAICLCLLLPAATPLQIVIAMLLKQSAEGVSSSPVAMALVSMICLYVAAFAWSW